MRVLVLVLVVASGLSGSPAKATATPVTGSADASSAAHQVAGPTAADAPAGAQDLPGVTVLGDRLKLEPKVDSFVQLRSPRAWPSGTGCS